MSLHIEASESMPVRAGEDVVRVRQIVRARAVAIGLSLVDQTKIITAASEIARNTIDYGGGGTMTLDMVQAGARKGLRLVFADNGPGIVDIQKALQDGYTSGGGLGLGLSGAKRLSSEFDIKTAPGAGTTVTLIRWK
jgi:serine/threonine-protein kinase RsbT